MGRAEAKPADYLKRRCVELDVICEKIHAEDRNGCPDYLLTFPNGRMKRVETKSDKGKCQPNQERYHRMLSRNSSFTALLYNVETIDEFFRIHAGWLRG